MVKQITPLNTIEEDQSPWGTDRIPLGCSHCKRSFLALKSQINSLCPLCGTGNLESQPLRIHESEPERLLPFKVRNENLQSIYAQFINAVWIKPDDFTIDHLLQRTRAVFWPLWLVDSDIKGNWQMEAGFDYQVESSKEYYQDSQWHSRKLIEDRIRWEPRLGQLDYHIDNISVPALEEHPNREQMTGSYRLASAANFQPSRLGDALLEVPDLPPKDAWPLAKPRVDRQLSRVCVEASGAQHGRNFSIDADYQNLNWTQFLLPMYTTYYKDDEGFPQILIINGETGVTQGPQLASQKRGLRIAGIIAVIAVGLLLLALMGFLLTTIFPPASIIAAFLGVLGFATGIGALVPAIWPAQWNRKHQSLKIIKRN